MEKKLTTWGVITLILTLGFGQLLRFQIFGIPIYLHDLWVCALLVVNGRTAAQQFYGYFLAPLLRNRSRNLSGFAQEIQKRFGQDVGLTVLFAGIALGWVIALTLFPISRLVVSFLYTVRFLAYLTLYLTLKHLNLRISREYFYLAGIITLVCGLLQYIYLPDMRWAQYLGWDDHLNRLTLPHFDPTFSAIMIALPFLLLLQAKEWLASLIFFGAILLTYSRSVWLSLGLTALCTIRNKYIVLLAFVVLSIGIGLLPHKFGEGNNLLRTYSITSRIGQDENILRRIGWFTFTGVGMNTLPVIMPGTSQYPEHATGPNNSYIYLLVTTGVIGFLGLVLFIAGIFRRSQNKSILIFILIASLFNNVFFYPFVLLWVVLAESVMVPSGS